MSYTYISEALDLSEFPHADENDIPTRKIVSQTKDRLAQLLKDPIFLRSCLDLELYRISKRLAQTGLLPFAIIPENGIRISFGYWWPGAVATAHEHTAWTITAICANTLSVTTFDRDLSYRCGDLVKKARLVAKEGQVGYIYNPAIHEPSNGSTDWSITLHLQSPRDGELIDINRPPIPALLHSTGKALDVSCKTSDDLLEVRKRFAFCYQIAKFIYQRNIPHAAALLNKCAELGSSRTRNMINGELPPSYRSDVVSWAYDSLQPEVLIVDDAVALFCDTPIGPKSIIRLNRSSETLARFIVDNSRFRVNSLPGTYSYLEKVNIAYSLEETGFFRLSDSKDN